MGFRVVDELARRIGTRIETKERKALTADGLFLGQRVLLVKPQTYMNLSGEAVRALLDFYKIDDDRLIVAYDDLDLPLGTIRLRKSGSAGGQKGMANILQHLGHQNVARVRVGIDRPSGRLPVEDYVLRPFSGDDEITARIMVDRAADTIETWLAEGIEIAMTRHNGTADEKNPTA
jgi:PTH1 family peptidyl-tRNA hydrolase